MKINLSLVTLLLPCFIKVSALKTLPNFTSSVVSGSKTLPNFTSSVVSRSKTLPTSSSVETSLPSKTTTSKTTGTTGITGLHPYDIWYYHKNRKTYYAYSHYDEICKVDVINNVNDYLNCLHSLKIDYSFLSDIKYISPLSSKMLPPHEVLNPLPMKRYTSKCVTKGGFEAMIKNSAIKTCRGEYRNVARYKYNSYDCPGLDYVCLYTTSKRIDTGIKKVITTTGKSNGSKTLPISSSKPTKSIPLGFKTSKTLPVSSTPTDIPTYYESYGKCCSEKDCSDSQWRCCDTNVSTTVNLVDEKAVWGIQKFDKDEYEWCVYKDRYPIYEPPESVSMDLYDSYHIMKTIKFPYSVTDLIVNQESQAGHRVCKGSICGDFFTSFVNDDITYRVYTHNIEPIYYSTSVDCKSNENECVTSTYKVNSITSKTLPIRDSTTITTTTTTKTLPIKTTITTTMGISCIPETITTTITEKVTEKDIVTVTVTVTSEETSSPNEKCANKWAQCGGINFKGPTCCESGSTCLELNKYFSQCV